MVAPSDSVHAAAHQTCCETHAASSELLEHAGAVKKEHAQPLGAMHLLWRCLEERQLHGFEFTHQHDLGVFVADFYCEQARLIVKVGDDCTRRERTPLCDQWARANNFRVIRLHKVEIEHNIEQVLNVIVIVLQATAATASLR